MSGSGDDQHTYDRNLCGQLLQTTAGTSAHVFHEHRRTVYIGCSELAAAQCESPQISILPETQRCTSMDCTCILRKFLNEYFREAHSYRERCCNASRHIDGTMITRSTACECQSSASTRPECTASGLLRSGRGGRSPTRELLLEGYRSHARPLPPRHPIIKCTVYHIH